MLYSVIKTEKRFLTVFIFFICIFCADCKRKQKNVIIENKEITAAQKKLNGYLINNICSILNKHGKGVLYFGVKPNGDVCGQIVSASSLDDVATHIKTAIKPMIYPSIKEDILDGIMMCTQLFGPTLSISYQRVDGMERA